MEFQCKDKYIFQNVKQSLQKVKQINISINDV